MLKHWALSALVLALLIAGLIWLNTGDPSVTEAIW